MFQVQIDAAGEEQSGHVLVRGVPAAGPDAVLILAKRFERAAGEYVDGMAHTNGVESFWAMLKREYVRTYHKLSIKHLDRYVAEFEGRHNQRPLDTIDQMAIMARGMGGKHLSYKELIGPRETRKPKIL